MIGLVGCASQKLQRPAPARDLYVSSLFRKASAYAEQECDRWYILSAKHGLVHPDDVLEPYDIKLGTKAAGPFAAWGAKVKIQLAEREGVEVDLLALAGGQYVNFFYFTPWTVHDPMKGMGIGQRLQFLTNALNN